MDPSASFVFNGTNSCRISVTMASSLQLHTGDFTIAWWAYETLNHSFPRHFSVGSYPNSNIAFDKEFTTVYYWDPTAVAIGSQTAEERYGVWTHYAICRRSGTITIYLNGTSFWSQSDGINYDLTHTLYIGGENSTDDAAFTGYIYGFCWLAGTALYNGNFTPTVDAPDADYQLNLTANRQYAADGITVTVSDSVGLTGPAPTPGGGGGGMGGDPQIRTLDGMVYTVPDYLTEFLYVETPCTRITCKTRSLDESDYPDGVWDHNGRSRVYLGPFSKEKCPHTYMESLHIFDLCTGEECHIDMDTLNYYGSIPLISAGTRTPMRTPTRNYPVLDTTKEKILRLRDMTLRLWSDPSLHERHNVDVKLRNTTGDRTRITGAIVGHPELLFKSKSRDTPDVREKRSDDVITMMVNGIPTKCRCTETRPTVLEALRRFSLQNELISM